MDLEALSYTTLKTLSACNPLSMAIESKDGLVAALRFQIPPVPSNEVVTMKGEEEDELGCITDIARMSSPCNRSLWMTKPDRVSKIARLPPVQPAAAKVPPKALKQQIP